jgi:hypothetical protein
MLTVGCDAVDLHDQPAVDSWFYEHRLEPAVPSQHEPAISTGITTIPGDFLHDNLAIGRTVSER